MLIMLDTSELFTLLNRKVEDHERMRAALLEARDSTSCRPVEEIAWT